MGSLSLAPDGRTLAVRVGPVDRITAPALCDLDSPKLSSRLLAPDDSSRIEWLATLVTRPGRPWRRSRRPPRPEGPRDRPARPALAPADPRRVRGELRRLPSPPPDRPDGPAALQPAVRRPAGRAPGGRPARRGPAVLRLPPRGLLRRPGLARRDGAPGRHPRPPGEAPGHPGADLHRPGPGRPARRTASYLKEIERRPARRIEWAVDGYRITEAEPVDGQGWPEYLEWRASQVQAQLLDEGPDHHVNPDAPKFNFGFDPGLPRNNPAFPDRPLFIEEIPPRPRPNRPPPGGNPRR